MNRLRHTAKWLVNMKWHHIAVFWAIALVFALLQFMVASEDIDKDEHVETAWIVPIDAFGTPEVFYEDDKIKLTVFTSDTTSGTWSYQAAIWATLNDSLDGFRLKETVRGDHFVLKPGDE